MKRMTRQKKTIYDVLEAAARPLTPQEVLEKAERQGQALSIATVYRNLKSMLEEGEIHGVSLPGEILRYELMEAAAQHHHHFQCTDCQRVFDVHDCPGETAWQAPPGFKVERHELILYGLCDGCAPDAARV